MVLTTLMLYILAPNLAQARLALPKSGNYTFLQNCIISIQEEYLKLTEITLVVNLIENLKDLQLNLRPVVIQSNYTDELAPFTQQKASAYVFIISEELVSIFFKILTKTSHWNPRGRFIIVFHGNVVNLFTVLKDIYVFNIVALTPESESEIEIYTYFPYNFDVPEDERTNPVLLDVCLDGRLQRHSVNLYPGKLPDTWSNFTVRLMFVEYPPYISVEYGSEVSPSGIELEVFQMVQEMLGFKAVYINKSYENWGLKWGSDYDGAFSDLQSYDADMGIGLFCPDVNESWDFDMSFPYMEDSSRWVVPIAKLEARWQKIVRIFYQNLWAITLTLQLLSLIMYFTAKVVSDLKMYQQLLTYFLFCIRCLITQGTDYIPRTGIVKTIFIACVVLGWVGSTIFQSQLMSALNFDTYTKQISTSQELIGSKMEFGYHRSLQHLFMDESSETDIYFLKNRFDCPLSLSCINRTAFQGGFATIKSNRLMQHLTNHYYLDSEGKPLVYVFKNGLYNLYITMACVRGFPMFERLNQMLINLKSNGFIEYIYRKSTLTALKYSRKKKMRTNIDVLHFYELQDIFAFLLLGCILATVVFILEFVFKNTSFTCSCI